MKDISLLILVIISSCFILLGTYLIFNDRTTALLIIGNPNATYYIENQEDYGLTSFNTTSTSFIEGDKTTFIQTLNRFMIFNMTGSEDFPLWARWLMYLVFFLFSLLLAFVIIRMLWWGGN